MEKQREVLPGFIEKWQALRLLKLRFGHLFITVVESRIRSKPLSRLMESIRCSIGRRLCDLINARIQAPQQIAPPRHKVSCRTELEVFRLEQKAFAFSSKSLLMQTIPNRSFITGKQSRIQTISSTTKSED